MSSNRGNYADLRMQEVGFTILLGFFIALSAQCDFAESRKWLSDADVKYISHRQSMNYENGYGDRGEKVVVDPYLNFSNPRLKNAYIALQAWKKAINSDPLNITGNWFGADVCNYTRVFCSPALDDPNIIVVAGIDLNHAQIAGYLPVELGLLTDIALFHINSNFFCGFVPYSFINMTEMFEFDISNNRFAGSFPMVVLSMPKLKYLDVRFNEFEGCLPEKLFEKNLDAIFINNNKFTLEIPSNLGNSPVSVIVLANNNLQGCLPDGLGQMAPTLNEIVLSNNSLTSFNPSDIGKLRNLTVFDMSFNNLAGFLPDSIGGMISLEIMDISHNKLSGMIPESICALPNLKNFTVSYNFFSGEANNCMALPSRGDILDDKYNCFPDRPSQRSFLKYGPALSPSMGRSASDLCKPIKISTSSLIKIPPSPSSLPPSQPPPV
ncbi:hypothetical protein SUGI_0692000 [Cryptomeria japonica]|nr:hypothetical protein SUGI_0692000 [Cryptomeria japonica]